MALSFIAVLCGGVLLLSGVLQMQEPTNASIGVALSLAGIVVGLAGLVVVPRTLSSVWRAISYRRCEDDSGTNTGGNGIDFYLVAERPGFDGPEVLSRDLLKPGTLIEIERVLECTNCLASWIRVEIRVLADTGHEEHPVYMEAEMNRYLVLDESSRATR